MGREGGKCASKLHLKVHLATKIHKSIITDRNILVFFSTLFYINNTEI